VPIPDVSDRALPELVSLRDRGAVVTGGAQGLGRAIARRLAEAGASVLIADIDEPAAAAAAGDLRERFGVVAAAVALDVADAAAVTAAADSAVAELGGIDIWVNNAGIYPSRPVLEMSDDEWDRVVGVNLRGTFIASREAARRMVQAGHGGVIVNLSSRAGYRGSGPGVPHYVASKFGVRGLTQQLALEFAEHGIRVLAVAPTRIPTPGVEAAMAGPADGAASTHGRSMVTPLGRVGVPDDVARVVLFCASDLALFMTGSTLVVDAGDMAP
jgi:NAD(P)-dependent dehydrogenase (short-subunit alcohol dehydrogenase family)